MANIQWPQGAPDASTPVQTGDKIGLYKPAEGGATKNVKVDVDDIKTYAEGTLSADIDQNASDIADNTAAIGVNTGLINGNTVDISSLESIQNVILSQLHPIGEVYTQYPGKLSPTELGYPGTWTNISSQFAGNFFRAEGGVASAFGSGKQSQATNLKSHSHSGSFYLLIDSPGSFSGVIRSTNKAQISNPFTQSVQTGGTAGDSETRPDNETVRIWERTA